MFVLSLKCSYNLNFVLSLLQGNVFAFLMSLWKSPFNCISSHLKVGTPFVLTPSSAKCKLQPNLFFRKKNASVFGSKILPDKINWLTKFSFTLTHEKQFLPETAINGKLSSSNSGCGFIQNYLILKTSCLRCLTGIQS